MRNLTVASKNGETIGAANSASARDARNLGENLVSLGVATAYRVWSRKDRCWL